jgi:hypothetical protein
MLSIKTLSIEFIRLSVKLSYCYAECQYAVCRYAECRGNKYFSLGKIMFEGKVSFQISQYV